MSSAQAALLVLVVLDAPAVLAVLDAPAVLIARDVRGVPVGVLKDVLGGVLDARVQRQLIIERWKYGTWESNSQINKIGQKRNASIESL